MAAEEKSEQKESEKKIELHSRSAVMSLVIALEPTEDPLIYLMVKRPELIRWGARIFQRETDYRYVEACEVTAFTDPGRRFLNPDRIKKG